MIWRRRHPTGSHSFIMISPQNNLFDHLVFSENPFIVSLLKQVLWQFLGWVHASLINNNNSGMKTECVSLGVQQLSMFCPSPTQENQVAHDVQQYKMKSAENGQPEHKTQLEEIALALGWVYMFLFIYVLHIFCVYFILSLTSSQYSVFSLVSFSPSWIQRGVKWLQQYARKCGGRVHAVTDQ